VSVANPTVSVRRSRAVRSIVRRLGSEPETSTTRDIVVTIDRRSTDNRGSVPTLHRHAYNSDADGCGMGLGDALP
jgi:hypothetical protein